MCPSSHGSQGSDLLMTFEDIEGERDDFEDDSVQFYNWSLPQVFVFVFVLTNMMNSQWSSKTGDHPRLLCELPHHGHMLLVRIPGEGNQLPQY